MVEAIRQGDIPGVQLRRRQEIPLALEEAWEWLTEPRRLGRWMAEGADADGKVLLLSSAGRRERGETLEQAAPRAWVLGFHRETAGWHRSLTRLSLRLHRTLGGTEVDLLHEGFHRLPPSLCLPVWEDYRRRWEGALLRLREVVTKPNEPEEAPSSALGGPPVPSDSAETVSAE